ncbi:MAG: hypothetical protein LC780_01815, partial [Acidobacteria bacterium]|nr:hypothetical protein [Acidobacteriota bacterium]
MFPRRTMLSPRGRPFRTPPAIALWLAAGLARAASPATETGVREFLAQRYPVARAALESAVRQDPSDARAAAFLGRVFFEENESDRAVRW